MTEALPGWAVIEDGDGVLFRLLSLVILDCRSVPLYQHSSLEISPTGGSRAVGNVAG
jgi:hypothetical protein